MMKKASRGFSLIEIMVALTIGLFLLMGLTVIYTSSKQTNRIEGMQSTLTDDGRFALSMLRRIVSQAGFRADPKTPFGATSGSATTIASTSRVTPVSASSFKVSYIGDGTNIISCDGAAASAGSVVETAISFSSGKLTCSPSINGAPGTTIDWIAPTAGGDGSEVIDFKVQYGVDTAPTTTPGDYSCGSGRDCIADSFVGTLPLPSSATNDQIVAVKVCVILRSEKTDSSILKASAVKDCSGADIATSQTDFKLYRAFRSTVLVKNLITNS